MENELSSSFVLENLIIIPIEKKLENEYDLPTRAFAFIVTVNELSSFYF